MKFFDKIWTLLGEKGKIATLIGLIHIIPINSVALFQYFKDIEMLTEQRLTAVFMLNIIGIVWFMLPSYIKLKGKTFELELKD